VATEENPKLAVLERLRRYGVAAAWVSLVATTAFEEFRYFQR
jgi:hypothetical protein